MRIPGVKTARLFSRWIQARQFGGALILGYHRVAHAARDDHEASVTPKHFAEQMEALNRVAQPISLRKLVRCLKAGSLPPKSVAVTFDDGYADNLYEAKPILEKNGIPATVFVCTGYAGKEFWWDEMERLVMSSQGELGALRLAAGKISFVWNQPEASPEADFDVRRKFRRALYHFLLELDVENQNRAMSTIRSWSGNSSTEPASRAMTHDELLQLVDGGLIEIGAHTRHHLMLPQLPFEQQREEIVSSKRDLEEWLGRRVDGFAYPNGMAADDTRQIVRDAGFVFACTSLHDVVRSTHDLYALTRFWQKDVNGEHFLQGIQLWMKGRRS
jgi:peptidoglycan/xylan/chitin deacetylase (PgdA/CDA1 family)